MPKGKYVHDKIKGRKRPEHSKLMKQRAERKGLYLQHKTKEHIENHRKSLINGGKVRGKNNGRYIDGRKEKYNEWRKVVFLRDNFTCQICGKYACYLNVHHIKSQSKHPELKYDISNGITLCYNCHTKKHPNGFRRGTEADLQELNGSETLQTGSQPFVRQSRTTGSSTSRHAAGNVMSEKK